MGPDFAKLVGLLRDQAKSENCEYDTWSLTFR